jgi:electron transport complex protein RnfD
MGLLKMTGQRLREKNVPPHIGSETSVAQRLSETGVAAAPVILAALFFWRARVFSVLLLSVGAAVAVEFLAGIFRGKKSGLEIASSGLTAVFFSAFLPLDVSAGAVILGTVVAVALGKAVFGGIGRYPFQPAMAGLAFLALCDASLFGGSILSGPEIGSGAVFDQGTAWLSFLLKPNRPFCIAQVSLAASLLGGVLLVLRRLVYLEVPLIYLASFSGMMWVLRGGPETGFSGLNAADFFLAFFIVSDPATTPFTRAGKWLFSFAAGVLGAGLRAGGADLSATFYTVLIMNATVPWIDELLCPSGVCSGDRFREIFRGFRLDSKTAETPS